MGYNVGPTCIVPGCNKLLMGGITELHVVVWLVVNYVTWILGQPAHLCMCKCVLEFSLICEVLYFVDKTPSN